MSSSRGDRIFDILEPIWTVIKVVFGLALVGGIFYGCYSWQSDQIDLSTNSSKMPSWMATERPLHRFDQPPPTQSCRLNGSLTGAFFVVVGSVNGSCQTNDKKVVFTWEVQPGRTMYSEVPLSILQVITDNSKESPTIRYVWWGTEHDQAHDKGDLESANPNDLVQSKALKFLEVHISAQDKAKEPALQGF
jgi:hypothetical protein